ncbi:MAG: hypothetical protein QOE33_3038, partial [Acidobacteriota bacterium]|nr:hypothetical protein [Acidobacteriota bacterium]
MILSAPGRTTDARRLAIREKAIAEYHEWLATDEGLDAEFFSRLKGEMRARRLLYGERTIGVALRPHLLARAQFDQLVRASEIVAGAFEKVCAALVGDESLLDLVGLTDAERRLALVDTGFSSPAVTTRLDAFVAGDEVKFVEYNAENPSSLPDQEGLNRVLFEVSAMRRLSATYRLREFSPVESLLVALVETYREWSGGAQTPNIAIVDWANLPTQAEFELLRDYFNARGVKTIICAPDDLEYANGKLRCRDSRVDLVYKRVVIHELLARCDSSHPLLRAYTDAAVCVVNPFRCKIVHKKAAFELLTDEARGGWFTQEEREVLRACVPWTRRVASRRTTRGDESIDLIEFVRRDRARLVLKPNDDYGGHGVYLGSRSTETEWDAAMEVALAGDYVVQDLIDLHTEEFPVFDDERWALQPMYVDTNPFLFNGRVEGAMVRLSESPVVNVTSGGGETGFFV